MGDTVTTIVLVVFAIVLMGMSHFTRNLKYSIQPILYSFMSVVVLALALFTFYHRTFGV